MGNKDHADPGQEAVVAIEVFIVKQRAQPRERISVIGPLFLAVIGNDLVGRLVQLVVDEARKFVVGAVLIQELVDDLIVFVPQSDLQIVAVRPACFVNFDKIKV